MRLNTSNCTVFKFVSFKYIFLVHWIATVGASEIKSNTRYNYAHNYASNRTTSAAVVNNEQLTEKLQTTAKDNDIFSNDMRQAIEILSIQVNKSKR